MHQTKRKILTAASELFLQGGSNALSVRAISKHAGLSTIGIYSHFQGKQGILDTLYIEGFEMVSKSLNVLHEGIDARAAVLQASKNYLQSAMDNEAHYKLIFGDSGNKYTPSEEAKEVGAKAFNELTDLIATLLPKSSTKAHKRKAAIQVWALIHGNITLKRHAVSQLVDMSDWKKQTLKSVEILIDAL